MLIKFLISKIYFCFWWVFVLVYDKKIIKKKAFDNINIISIGNLSVGGSGKTPMALFVSTFLKSKNIKHAVVSRGYKKKSKGEVVVSHGNGPIVNCLESGDEAYMFSWLSKEIPVVVGNKIKACEIVEKKFNINTIILDDGFQTLKLNKNVDILLIDLSVPLSDYRLIPLGKMREPLSAIKRAKIIVYTKKNLSKNYYEIKSLINPYINKAKQNCFDSNLLVEIWEYVSFKKSFLKNHTKMINEPVVCFSGIANTQSFVRSSHLKCSNIKTFLSFSDHHNYSSFDIDKIIFNLKKFNTSIVVTTMKDFVKIRSFFQSYRVCVLNVEHDIINKKDFYSTISQHL